MIGIILAAGNSTRFGGFPKQLLRVDGETLLDRQARLFCDYAHPVYLVTHRPEWELSHPKMLRYIPASRRWKCDTLLSTTNLWREDFFVLHGDVYFTTQARDKIVSYSGEVPCFYWDGEQDAFAIHVPIRATAQFEILVRKLVENTERNPVPAPENDCGFGSLITAAKADGFPAVFETINDVTQDFDTPEEYEGWNNGWRKNKARAKIIQ